MLRNAFADLATDDTLQDVLAKLPAAPATEAKQDAIRALLVGVLAVKQTGTALTDRTVPALSAGQAAGTASVIDSNPARRAIMITPVNDGRLYIASAVGAGFYWPLYAGVTKSLTGADCPTNTLFVTGQPAGATLAIAEG